MKFESLRPMGQDMEVLDSGESREALSWTFLVEGTVYYFDIQYSMGKYRPYLLFRLTSHEMGRFIFEGRSYLNALAEQVRAFPAKYYERNQPIDVQKRVAAACAMPRVRNANALSNRVV